VKVISYCWRVALRLTIAWLKARAAEWSCEGDRTHEAKRGSICRPSTFNNSLTTVRKLSFRSKAQEVPEECAQGAAQRCGNRRLWGEHGAKGVLQHLVVEPEVDGEGAVIEYYLVTIGYGRVRSQLLRDEAEGDQDDRAHSVHRR
jgi:hypothetical protein